jgi:hypothetical protein
MKISQVEMEAMLRDANYTKEIPKYYGVGNK